METGGLDKGCSRSVHSEIVFPSAKSEGKPAFSDYELIKRACLEVEIVFLRLCRSGARQVSDLPERLD